MLDIAVMVAFWLLPLFATMAVARYQAPHGATQGGPNVREGLPVPGVSSWLLWALVAVPSVLQLAVPDLLVWLRRDWARICAGQVWRLVTSVVVQDGSLSGMVFNLVILGLVVLAAQDYWSPVVTWAVFLVGAVVANVIVGPGLNPVGAGNSMATFVLATALATSVLARRPARTVVIPAAGALAVVVFLLVAGNYHGFAALAGVPIGLAAHASTRRTGRRRTTTPAPA